jgi:hypothetical protein
MTISLEKAARALLGRERERGQDGDGREHGRRPAITLPRVRFLERELPSRWNEPIPPAPKPERAGRRKATP